VPFVHSNELRIHISKRLFSSLREMFQLTRLSGDLRSLEMFASELLEANVAEFRLRKITEAFPLPPPGGPSLKHLGIDVHRRALRPAQIQRVLFLAETANLCATAIAERMGVTTTTVRRILERRSASAIRVPPAPRPAHGQRWCKTLPPRKTEAQP
jgi:hypothetical protein